MIKDISRKTLAEFGFAPDVTFKEDTKPSSTEGREQDRGTVDQSNSVNYAGDEVDNAGPLEKDGYRTLPFAHPAEMLAVIRESVRNGEVVLYDWQLAISHEFGDSLKIASALHPYKYALCAANGSGKDAFVLTPFVIWFALVNVKALTIITSSSGQQLTSQTENYIKSLAEEVNAYFGQSIFRIRQRFIKCYLTGSEIRLFATDEAGKAEGYHPLEPNAKMSIIVNEAKSVSEEIFEALRRCTGYTHWINVSTPGAPKGTFYRNFNNWKHTRRVDFTHCPRHMSEDERLEDLRDYGANSAYYRSKWLALFTSLEGNFIIPRELLDALLTTPPQRIGTNWKKRIGIDLSAGGDETVVCITQGNKVIKLIAFREKDTTVAADKINSFLLANDIPFSHEHIYGDDGGVGHSILDMLVRMGWNINRIINQARAVNNKAFGNRGAELWDRAKRLFEERIFSPEGMDDKLIEQLTTRKYKELVKGKTFLESKREAKAEGIHSPDRADAFILSLTGLSIDDFFKDVQPEKDDRPRVKLTSQDDILKYYTDNITYGHKRMQQAPKHKRAFNSLNAVIDRNDYE